MNTVVFWDSAKVKPVLQKVFHHVLLGFGSNGSPISTFFQTALQILEVILFLLSLSLTFHDISDKFTVYLCLFICAPHQTAIALSSSSLFALVVDKKMPSL